MVEAILAAGKSMHAYGIACAHDMMTGGTDLDLELETYQLAAERGNPIDVRLYVQWSDALGRGARHAERLKVMRTRPEGSRSPIVAGVKIFADGAIGSATAAIYGGYGEEGSSSRQVSSQVSGQLMYPPERLTTMVREAHHEGWSVATHAIGDYAADLVMNAYEATPEPSRHRIEHAMMLSDGQIERLARLGVAVSMQPEFLVRFGHTYRLQLGERRASLLNRAQSLTAAGVSVSFSSDRPIVSGDPWLGIQSSVRRPEGFDPSENVTPQTALAGYLDRAASISHDRTDTAALALGCLAKGLVVEEDPLEARGRPQTITWLSEFIQGETDQSQR
jgi:predicted amidohydrolase YtcJ